MAKDGHVTIATGHDEDFVELETPAKIHGLVWALFFQMWEHEDMKRLFTDDYKAFDLVASTVVTVYNQAFKTGGALPQNDPMQAPDMRVHIVHDAEAPPKAGYVSDRQKSSQCCGPGAGQQAPQKAASSSDARQDEQWVFERDCFEAS